MVLKFLIYARPDNCLAGVQVSCISRVSPVSTSGVWIIPDIPTDATINCTDTVPIVTTKACATGLIALIQFFPRKSQFKTTTRKKHHLNPILTYQTQVVFSILTQINYNCGPAATKALPASLPSYLAKFLMKRPAKSLAFSSHCAASA